MPAVASESRAASAAMRAAIGQLIDPKSASEGNKPDKPCAEYLHMKDSWDVINALWGGTKTMRAAREALLPKMEKEHKNDYEARLNMSYLFNGFKRAVVGMMGRVFAKPIQFGKDAPKELNYLVEDCDRMGNHLNVFAQEVFKEGVKMGLTHILIDMPKTMKGATLADERKAKHRPYFCHLKPEQVIGWRGEVIDGSMKLTMLRSKHTVEKPSGEFGMTNVTQVRVHERDYWRVYELTPEGKWKLEDEGENKLGEIPLVTFYTGYTGFMTADPPCMDLAETNLAHWQSNSDQRNILHTARVPILFGKNMASNKSTGGTDLTIGKSIIKGGPDSDLKYVEHGGQAIEAGLKDIHQLEEKMAMQGLEPLQPRSSNPTATGRLLDSMQTASLLQQWAIAMSDALERAFVFAGQWMGLKVEQNAGSVEINAELAFSLRDAQDLQTLYQSRIAKEITRETYWKELQRRNVLSDSFDAEAEKEKLDDEGPAVPPEKTPPGKKVPGTKMGGAA